MRILITGGAGYIGSHVLKALSHQGHDITIIDNLSTGHAKAVTSGDLIVGDLSELSLLENLFTQKKFEVVFHFAGSIVVSDSVARPIDYYSNNTLNSFNLINICVKHGCNNFIFSSTAAIYGIDESGIVSEKSLTRPINPYGHSKLMTEQMLADVASSSSLRYVALRYFNVSGADPDGKIGQSFPQATHLIKVACEVATGKRSHIDIFGTDYSTSDGTCIRDYIHVTDLANAHVKALDYLLKGGKSEFLNCGYGHGFSVKEVLEKVKDVTGINIQSKHAARRAGDPASLVAKAEKIKKILDWNPQYDDLALIIKSAYDWEKSKSY